ncbi:gfo/Idh/MocA family oxidoreductase [Kocuria sediminis]|uniref:Gfo/Idh/MocA family oxidoreductase n=1 Tax=Kocuria sediminis TaxID=1038857 RepID=A0A6N8GN15_9MICC|nr:Gfo/Idh/MocA family oxidoreductase [Kocuria sediminis]MUN64506.1 gfo/Idh/MocA family oxidoreductase [Kocuria sediminis]
MTNPAPEPAARTDRGPAPDVLGVAVLGYSFMGKAHSNAWRNVNAFYPVPRVAQRVLVGRDAGHVAAAARRYGWEESSTDWRSVLERPDVDVVDICTPGHLHADMAVAALEAGKHVLVEKPLANTVAEAERMAAAAAAARARGVHAMVGFNYRRVPALALARTMIADGRVGEVRQVRASYLQDWLADEHAPMTWRLRRETAGSGALGDLASHAVDQVRFLLGSPVTSVSGTTDTFVRTREGPDGTERVTVDDAAWATLRTDSGAVVSLEVSRCATGRKNALELEVYGSRGGLRFDLERLNELQLFDTTAPGDAQGYSRILVTEDSHPYAGAWWPPGHTLGWDHTFTSQAADFLHAIDTGVPAAPDFADGLAVQRVLHAVTDSAARDGAAVRL